MSESTPTQPAQSNGPEACDSAAAKTAPQTEDAPLDAEAVESDPAAGTGRSSFLFRHPEDRLLGGICAGLGDSLNIDPVLVRIIWITLTLATAGAGLFAYAALWLLLPVGTAQAGQRAPASLELNQRNVERAGLLLVLVGGLWLLANLGILPVLWSVFWDFARMIFWPVFLIGAGLLMLKNQGAWRRRLAATRDRMQSGKTRAVSSLNRESVKRFLGRARSNIPLKRSREDRLICGVCGGIGRAIHLDANLIRLIWFCFSIGSVGAGVLVYALAVWLLPEETPALEPVRSAEPQEVTVIDGSVG